MSQLNLLTLNYVGETCVVARPAEEQERLSAEFGALMTTNDVKKTLGPTNSPA